MSLNQFLIFWDQPRCGYVPGTLYLVDLRQSGKVGWEEVEGLLMLLFMLNRKTMAMLFSEMVVWSYMDIWMYTETLSYGCTIIQRYMDVLSELINCSDQLVQFD